MQVVEERDLARREMGSTMLALVNLKSKFDTFYQTAEQRRMALEGTQKVVSDAERSMEALQSNNTKMRASLTKLKTKVEELTNEKKI